jgi:hypothetical protein
MRRGVGVGSLSSGGPHRFYTEHRCRGSEKAIPAWLSAELAAGHGTLAELIRARAGCAGCDHGRAGESCVEALWQFASELRTQQRTGSTHVKPG